VVTAGLLVLFAEAASPQTVRSSPLRPVPAELTQHAAPTAFAGTISSQAQVFIAFKGHICTAIAYWVQGDTLHYITAQGSHNQVSLVLVDRPTSAKLNSGRLVKLVLPPP
jgi:endonuclease YncB( thermonuclease family)